MKCFVVRRVAVIPTMCHFTVLPFFPAALYGRKWHHWLRGSKLCHVLKILKTTIRRPSVRALHARTRCKNVCFHLQGFPVFIPRMDTTINTIKLPTIDTNWSMQKTQIIPYLSGSWTRPTFSKLQMPLWVAFKPLHSRTKEQLKWGNFVVKAILKFMTQHFLFFLKS